MDSLRWWACEREAVRQAIELGESAHMETAREEVTDAFLLCAIARGLLPTWAEAFPDLWLLHHERVNVIPKSLSRGQKVIGSILSHNSPTVSYRGEGIWSITRTIDTCKA